MTSRFLNSCFLLSRLILILLASSAITNTTFGSTNETDRRALLAIKEQIPGDPFGAFSSWNDSFQFCHWQGVTCSRRHQRVTVLDLSSLKLEGSMSPHIGNLSFLRAINLENNSFHGAIPQEIGRLFRLRQLLIYNNSFQGDFPTNLSRCSDIEVINLDQNNLLGTIPTELGSLSSLLELSLSKNHFTGLIPPSLGNLSSLRTLHINYNNLEGNIPSELGQLRNLESLQLVSNNLSGMVPAPLYNISSIFIFALPLNQLHGSLPPDLGLTLPNLQEFYLGDNKFSGPFPPSIANASALSRFDIAWNSFTGPVPMNLGSLRDLELLNLLINRLGTNKPNDLSFIDSLVNCTNLRLLQLTKNGFGGMIPNSIANLSTKLTTLRLDGNFISGSIPQQIGNLHNLVSFALNENLLIGSIPESVGKLSKLQGLYLYTNNISGDIPSSIGNMTRLSVLALQRNMLEGSIPIALSSCRNIQGLDLQRNRLSGLIPEQIMELSSLTLALNLNQNYLTGPLPFQVGNLKNLGQLDVSGNKLTGEIPRTLGDCQVLEYLYMQGNLFEGTLPQSFQQLKGIQVLDVSHNNLSGQIPSFLGKLSLIQNLNMSYNMFEGEVPNEGVFRNISAFSVVENMKLCGGIQALGLPTCLTKVPEKEKEKRPFPRRLIPLVIMLPIALLLACLPMILYRLRLRSKRQASSNSLSQNQYQKLSYAELRQATDGFSSTNLIGKGSHGSVYKGILNSGEQIVAVKVLNLQQLGAKKSFWAECEALRNLRHRNLIKIITCCSSIDFKGNDFKALVFEFMPNGSLDSWLLPTLSKQQKSQNLNFVRRLNIAIDVASALDYLHHDCQTAISHCDLKPSNVLLDNDLCAHVGDFGLARFLLASTSESNHTQSSSAEIRGTIGYLAPEYGMGGKASTQGDVYSYGILLLEMFTGKRPTDSIFMYNFSIHNYVNMALPDQVMEIVDPHIILEDDSSNRIRQGEGNIAKMESCLVSIFQIGVLCSAVLPSQRMDIRDVVRDLHVMRNVFLGREEE